jgi:hypothetical protein
MKVLMLNATKTASRRCERVEVAVISNSPIISIPAAFPPDEHKFAGTVPVLKNGGFPPFLKTDAWLMGSFLAPSWDFSPHIGKAHFR